jgi:ribosomal protein S17
MEENKVKLCKKWWFWVCIVLLALIVSFVFIMMVGFKIATSNINKVAKIIQNIDSETTVYSSAGNNTVVVEIPNYKNETKKEKKEDILNSIKTLAKKGGELETYSKFILITKTGTDNNPEYFYSTAIYNLPDMTENSTLSKTYVDFVEITKVYANTYSYSNTTDISTNKGEDITLIAGNYIVGEDIKPGKYNAIAQSGSGNFFVYGTTSVNEIMGTTDNKYYLKNYNNITLKNGDTVEIHGKLKLLLQAK